MASDLCVYVPHASLYLMTGLAMASVVVVTGCSKKTETEISSTSVPTSAEVSNNQSTDEKLGTKWGDEIESKTTGVDITRMTTDPIEESSTLCEQRFLRQIIK